MSGNDKKEIYIEDLIVSYKNKIEENHKKEKKINKYFQNEDILDYYKNEKNKIKLEIIDDILPILKIYMDSYIEYFIKIKIKKIRKKFFNMFRKIKVKKNKIGIFTKIKNFFRGNV